MKSRVSLLLLLVVVGGCRCKPGPVEPIELGLRVQPSELEFGRVLEGATKTQTITLTAATRAGITVTLGTDAPFSVATSAEVPGGGDVVVPVSFRATHLEAEGVLTLTVGDRSAQLRLHGVGVRPPDCRPSAECVVSVYSLDEDRCIESQAADDAPCDPASVCLEQGRCRSGSCLGVARRCDDNDVCTDDACAMDLGCIHTTHVCPRPAGACKVATCDSRLGCGEGPAADLTECGPVNCTEVNFCFSGMCMKQPTPDGLPCSPAFACLPEAQCHNQACTRITEADWAPTWSARLEGEPSGPLASSGATLFFSMCLDAGAVDAGAADAGPLDAGGDDAGEDDAGIDAGTRAQLTCGLTSYTGTGFERFERDGGRQPSDYEDDAPRTVLSVNSQGVVLRRDGGLELRSTMTGALRDSLPLEVPRSLVVIERDRILFWSDGGVQSWADGGVQVIAALDEPASMARGEVLFAWNADAGVLTRLSFVDDGGIERQDVATTGIATTALSAVRNEAILGPVGRLSTDGRDAGLVLFDWSTLPVSRFLDDQTLSSATASNVFFLTCDADAGCGRPDDETRVAAFNPSSGELLWEVAVASPAFPGTILSSTLVDTRPGAFLTVMRADLPGGAQTVAALFADGERKAVCRLPAISGAVEAAHFTTSALVVTVRRADGSVVLESYNLGSLPLSRTGWPTPQGVNGTRSDRP